MRLTTGVISLLGIVREERLLEEAFAWAGFAEHQIEAALLGVDRDDSGVAPRLVAMKWTFRRRQVGRPPMANEVRALILEMARSESRWGYTSIRDRLHNLGYRVSRTTVANVLEEGGLEPAPKRRRRRSWSAFLKAQWPGLAAIDFITVEVWTADGRTGRSAVANASAACSTTTTATRRERHFIFGTTRA